MRKRLGNLLIALFRRSAGLIQVIAKPIYKVYEVWLWSQICDGPVPRHVAIIPDGNRRWARSLGLNPIVGHNVGYEKLKEVLNWLWDLGIKVVTVYAMSYENCTKRSEDEVNNLFHLLKRGIEEIKERGEIDRRRIRIKFFGRFELVPKDVLNMVKEVEEYSSKYSERFLNIAICYGGRQDIINAVKRIAGDIATGKASVNDIDEGIFRKYLSTSHLLSSGLEEPDLVIRTSGELRLSNFLLWQIAYSELYFCDALWPEFRRIDLWRAIRSYQRRERRFGR